jgi:hypothetical protein
LRGLCGQQGNGEVPPAEFAKDLAFLPEIGERDRGLSSAVVEPAGEEEERRLRIERDLAGFTRAAKSRTWFIIPYPF